MKKFLIPLFALILSTALFAQDTTSVVFQVNMGAQIFRGAFSASSDSLTVRGNFQVDAGDAADWAGYAFKMSKISGDSIWAVTARIPNDSSGKSYEYKFVKNDDGWEGLSSNRSFTFDTSSATQTLPVVYFNDDSSFVLPPKNTIKFSADLTSIIGTGVGFFDPSSDTLTVAGMNWEGETLVSPDSNRVMQQDLFNPNIFSATLTVRKAAKDSSKWKFKAIPSDRFTNAGWELGNDRWYTYSSDSSITIILDPIVPNISPVQPPLSADLNVTFTVDMNGAKERYNNGNITGIEFVGMRGGASFLGDWVASGGTWTVADTVGLAHMLILYDDGTHGDVTASDNWWSLKITVLSGTNGGIYEYKFGAKYTNSDTLNAGVEYMDNEMGFGSNHSFLLKNGPDLSFAHTWGVIAPITGIERENNLIPDNFTLSQNYPNPFNPSTLINYSIPVPGLVTIKVYDMLGREVTTLINSEQAAGNYKLTFDASTLASGVYFYRIMSNNFVSTKKMLLMK